MLTFEVSRNMTFQPSQYLTLGADYIPPFERCSGTFLWGQLRMPKLNRESEAKWKTINEGHATTFQILSSQQCVLWGRIYQQVIIIYTVQMKQLLQLFE